ncbi:B12-binding domain-containing protein [Yoonia sp. R2331]|uniref:cobalamin B12-binding domain-containing protein n=1 Tax=Yoonia sp. R2331 TaxID=3237238 RepID=UPI0034E429C5
MARKPIDNEHLDRSAYDAADAHFRRVHSTLPSGAVETLAREVVRRLAFRMPRTATPNDQPTAEEIEMLCADLLSLDETAADRFILNVRRDGASPEMIYLGFVAGAARRLGEMWEQDRVSFLEVTLASGRLYRIIRGLRHVIDTEWYGLRGKPTLFALVPDETHTLGIEIATDLFRREGWDVELSVGEDHETIVSRTEANRFQAIVLVANSESMVTQLVRLVLALRITQPMAKVVVAGNVVNQVDGVDALTGADAAIPDIETAIEALRAIMRMDAPKS